MGHTNSTANLSLPQFIGTDKPTWLGDVNGAFSAIDSYAGTNDAAVAAAVSDASSAIAQAASAVSTANAANTTAGNASTAATNAVGTANNAVAIAGTVDSKVGLLADLTTTDRTSIVNAINEVNAAIGTPTAAQVSYDNTGSGLTATDVQAAIDEIAQGGSGSSIDLIYTNPNDAQSISAGTFTTIADQPTYKFFIAKIRCNTQLNPYIMVNIPDNTRTRVSSFGSTLNQRDYTISQAGGTVTVTADDGSASSYGGSPTTNNDVNIISELYGVR